MKYAYQGCSDRMQKMPWKKDTKAAATNFEEEWEEDVGTVCR